MGNGHLIHSFGQFIRSIFWKGLNFDGAEKNVFDFFLDPKACSGMFFQK